MSDDLPGGLPPAHAAAAALLDQLRASVCEPLRASLLGPANRIDPDASCVAYWMLRAQRAEDNLALDTAIAAAAALRLPLVVVVRLGRGPAGTAVRHIDHLVRALPDVAAGVSTRGATMLVATPTTPPPAQLLTSLRPALVVTDGDVMHRAAGTRRTAATELRMPLVQVETDTVAPVSAFDKREYAARTLRPRMHRVLERYLADGPAVQAVVPHGAPMVQLPGGVFAYEPATGAFTGTSPADLLEAVTTATGPDARAGALTHPAGPAAARTALDGFVAGDLTGYATQRNKPELDATSRLSHHLHFGHLSPRVAVLAARASGAPAADVTAFVEELVVRRELSWNLVRHTADVATLRGVAPDWALRTLDTHAADPREWCYPIDELEAAATHDPLWNAAQRQMMATGLMHGYLRMYWAKKILEWSPGADEAYHVALTLNDRWHLDGRDPNGITGVAWAIGGVHDRPWGERPIFGTIRYMSLASTGRKFDSRAYIERWGGAGAQLTLG